MTTEPRRVVVTGLGATTPVGGDVPSTWEGLLAGRSGVRTIEDDRFADLPVRFAGQVAVDPSEVMERPEARKLDRMTMAFSVEGRVPFAAPAVQAHAAKLRLGEMVRPGVLKWALRRAFAPLLPDEVVQRPKHGFNVPIDHWLKGQWSDLVEEAFSPGWR